MAPPEDHIASRSDAGEFAGTAATPAAGGFGRSNMLAVVAIFVFVVGLYWRTTILMVGVWYRSETFVHGFLVIPIFLWLVWRQRRTLDTIEPSPFYPALAGIVGSGLVWLVGRLVSAVAVSQFAMVAMIPFAVWTVLGSRMARTLAIPLAFLFFAVPFGEFLVPTLMDRTADFTVWAIRASGVPVYREGNFFTIPSGKWSVVEACSGLRYLIASVMVGTLYAYLFYRSTRRRLAFLAACVAVPIVANWVRAYMIVMLGHLTSNRIAVGADHLIYGWVFFAVVMLLLFVIGSRWREDEVGDRTAGASSASPAAPPDPKPLGRASLRAAVVSLAAIMLWQPIEAWLVGDGADDSAHLVAVTGAGAWQASSVGLSTWRPDVSGERAELRQTFMKGDARVGLHIAFFRHQTDEAKAITSGNQVVATTNPRWRQVGYGVEVINGGGHSLRTDLRIVADERERLAVLQWFWVNGRVTSSEYAAKLYQALSVVTGHGDAVAWIVAFAPVEIDEAQARATLRSFVAENLNAIDAALRTAAN
ncbi:MAG TPA: exosortase A [Casimicrobiaceae bacterium]|nr:exosortase A [Casimicrobiaceae bacterium]